MSTAQDKIGALMLKELVNLRSRKGAIHLEDMGAILENLAEMLTTEVSQQDKFLRQEIEKMAADIKEAKKEIFALQPAEKDKKTSDEATQQLSAIVKFTEDATNEIMNIADEIQAMAADLPKEQADKLGNLASRIFETCSFQDLTTQRITKVTGALDYIDAKIARLVALFSDKEAFERMIHEQRPTTERPDEHLMHGPSDHAPDQSQIDALFGDIKTGTS